jgi:hypothetical protein
MEEDNGRKKREGLPFRACFLLRGGRPRRAPTDLSRFMMFSVPGPGTADAHREAMVDEFFQGRDADLQGSLT